MLNEYLLGANESFFPHNWKFMQDNAPVHTSKETKNWLRDNEVDVIEWPAFSPDLNPIENVSGILSRRVYANGTQYNNLTDLRASIERNWNSLSVKDIKNHCDFMPMRIYELQKSKV